MDSDADRGSGVVVALQRAIAEAAAHAEAYGDRETERELLEILHGMSRTAAPCAGSEAGKEGLFFF